tara:strand:+ start:97 stop:342 length:246 start_codon:yes stop_codon:yes gene_type:complete
MEVTVHLDGDPTVREEGFFENKVSTLEDKICKLQYDNAVLQKTNDELAARVTKLASRQPSWPKGYQPQRRYTPKKNWTNNR